MIRTTPRPQSHRQRSLYVSPTEVLANASQGVQDPEPLEQGGSPFKEIPKIPFPTAKVEESKNEALDTTRATDKGKGRETITPPAEAAPSETMSTAPLMSYSPFQGHHGNPEHEQAECEHNYGYGHQHDHTNTHRPQHGYAPESIGSDSDFDQHAWAFVNVSPDTGTLGGLQTSPVQGSLSSWTNVEEQFGGGLSPLPAALTPDALSGSPEGGYQFPADDFSHFDGYTFDNVDINSILFPDPQYEQGMAAVGRSEQPASHQNQQPQNFQDDFDLHIVLSDVNVPPWDPLHPGGLEPGFMDEVPSPFNMEDFNIEIGPGALSSSPPESINSQILSHHSAPEDAPYLSVQVQQRYPAPSVPVPGPSSSSHATSKPTAIHKTRGNARVQKKKVPPSPSTVTFSSTSPGSVTVNISGENKFVVITPQSISQNAAKGSSAALFGGKDAEGSSRTTLRGRKGPLAISTAVSALQVRRIGACFCCHARKVSCEETRPCRRCEKLKLTVPEVICWQFSDFTEVIFPGWLKVHLKREGAKGAEEYVRENVASFSVRFREDEEDSEKPIKLRLTLGRGFNKDAMLTVFAKFFTPTPNAPDATRWYTVREHSLGAGHGLVLEESPATPIALPYGWLDQREELRRHLRQFHEGLYNEDQWAYLLTQSCEHTTKIPNRVLPILRRYANESRNGMVKRALQILTMNYTMSYHLHLDPESVHAIEAAGYRVPEGLDRKVLTARVLNRQLKAVTNDMIEREVRRLFEDFSKALKPRSRKEWAGCFAAFVALSVFLEYKEAQADAYVVMENEVKKRDWLYKVQQRQQQQQYHQHQQQEAENILGRKEGGIEDIGEIEQGMDQLKMDFTRKQAWDTLEAIDNLPFKQFMYQFHQIYQTHPSTAKDGKAFNPFVDDEALESLREFPDGEAAIYMVKTFRDRFFDVSDVRHELDFLTFDPSGPPKENVDPFTDPANKNKTSLFHLFTGRLLSKFLLSFIDERMIMGSTGFTGGGGNGGNEGVTVASNLDSTSGVESDYESGDELNPNVNNDNEDDDKGDNTGGNVSVIDDNEKVENSDNNDPREMIGEAGSLRVFLKVILFPSLAAFFAGYA
ncbi:hypothetical protein NEUTE1DRAFT_146466 [Neurospora tetrasperma FGSC 2508]|uniref:Zn(2)-C6 fungal-type domain-containing protein n=1 Tax=Neurospora tetrasperma (strain FGSC 2508 / ATCC MYA-4615 / P0657) TaxID=510951 RepID=F8MMW0_NEUT8|nr:uncharacterized protein NEUTE1DRAFT_146466 [Neurospora tetrasperma FGSC 2508]EGO57984.1 hypothetical protein NEUTE1DRAFT_146466 [Neurospora tetrasperma FGSC 2508]